MLVILTRSEGSPREAHPAKPDWVRTCTENYQWRRLRRRALRAGMLPIGLHDERW
jgi:hypothetical protein